MHSSEEAAGEEVVSVDVEVELDEGVEVLVGSGLELELELADEAPLEPADEGEEDIELVEAASSATGYETEGVLCTY